MRLFRISHLSGLLVIWLLQGCIIDHAQTIYGDGNVVTEQRDVASFTKLKVSAGIDVYITQGDAEKMEIEADENLHEVILTKVSDGTLRVYTEHNIRKAKAKKVHLTYKDLSAIKVSSAGDVVGVNRMKTDELSISLSSAGDINLELDASHIDVNITSSGDARLSGTTATLDASLSSAGDLDAYELEAQKCKVRVSSAGDARVNASEEFDLSSSSAGDIHYMGEGDVVRAHSSSAGSIRKK